MTQKEFDLTISWVMWLVSNTLHEIESTPKCRDVICGDAKENLAEALRLLSKMYSEVQVK